jgi:hypothetical protein
MPGVLQLAFKVIIQIAFLLPQSSNEGYFFFGFNTVLRPGKLPGV